MNLCFMCQSLDFECNQLTVDNSECSLRSITHYCSAPLQSSSTSTWFGCYISSSLLLLLSRLLLCIIHNYPAHTLVLTTCCQLRLFLTSFCLWSWVLPLPLMVSVCGCLAFLCFTFHSKSRILKLTCLLLNCEAFVCFPACVNPAVTKKRRGEQRSAPLWTGKKQVSWAVILTLKSQHSLPVCPKALKWEDAICCAIWFW